MVQFVGCLQDFEGDWETISLFIFLATPHSRTHFRHVRWFNQNKPTDAIKMLSDQKSLPMGSHSLPSSVTCGVLRPCLTSAV